MDPTPTTVTNVTEGLKHSNGSGCHPIVRIVSCGKGPTEGRMGRDTRKTERVRDRSLETEPRTKTPLGLSPCTQDPLVSSSTPVDTTVTRT